MNSKYFVFFLLIIVLSGCASYQNSPKYDLANGVYKIRIDNKKFDCFVENSNDTIKIISLSSKISTTLSPFSEIEISKTQKLIKSSNDIDILTAIFKLRTSTENLPIQLNTNFNGNLYFGRRKDIYQIKYFKNPISQNQRVINHFGFSGGFFFGIGNTAINPSTTNNAISTEYDGLILQKGVAGIVGINKLTVGASIGFDNLIDSDKKHWIYQNKPWFGLMLGLNLN